MCFRNNTYLQKKIFTLLTFFNNREEANTIINIIYTENKISESRFPSDIDNIPIQNSIMKEGKEEKLLREQFQKFRKSKENIPNFLRKGGCNSSNPSTIRRRSFHRSEPNKKSNNENNTLPCLLYHKHHPQKDKTTSLHCKFSHVCKTKSNSIPRSSVERKQRRKRTKMCKMVENKQPENMSQLHHMSKTNKAIEAENLNVSEPSKSEPISTISSVELNNFPKIVPKIHSSETLVYL